MRHPILLSWSGGKDSAFALHTLRSSPDFEPVGLLTTITADFDRISIHGVRRELLERQADAIGLPLRQVPIPKDCTNEIYEDRLARLRRPLLRRGSAPRFTGRRRSLRRERRVPYLRPRRADLP